MKALSVRQPHADRILRGAKTIELRTWSTTHRGDLLICASKTVDPGGKGLPIGVALCIVRLVDCRKMQRKDCAGAGVETLYTDAYSWILSDVRPVEPVPVKGRLGLFDVDDRLIKGA